ncbi:MAG: class I SAM-dependent methyltransferase [Actinomycetota bacterium]
MSLGSWSFAWRYDHMMARVERSGLAAQRERLLTSAKGSVLEIGSGTGSNLRYYGGAVGDLTLTEPEPAMVKRLTRRVRNDARSARVLRAPAEDLPFDDDTFDVAVSTLVLCTVDDQPRALRELRRVLRPGGQLLFIEHVRADSPTLARWQDRLNGLNRFVAHGCNCNRPTLATIGAAGFTVREVSHDRLPKAPPFVSPLVVGVADVVWPGPDKAGITTTTRR